MFPPNRGRRKTATFAAYHRNDDDDSTDGGPTPGRLSSPTSSWCVLRAHKIRPIFIHLHPPRRAKVLPLGKSVPKA